MSRALHAEPDITDEMIRNDFKRLVKDICVYSDFDDNLLTN